MKSRYLKLISVSLNNSKYSRYIFPHTADKHILTFWNFSAFTLLPSLVLFFTTYFILEVKYLGLLYPKRMLKKFGILQPKQKLNLKPLAKTFGTTSNDQVVVLILFILTNIVLMNRTILLKWDQYFDEKNPPLESLPTVFLLILYFALPRDFSFLRYWIENDKHLPRHEIPSIVKWEFLEHRLPWEDFLITGCTTAISAGMPHVLDDMHGFYLNVIEGPGRQLIILKVISAQYGLTQLTVSATTVNLLMELLKNGFSHLEIHPLYYVMPIAFIGNMSFILPVSSPSNVIVHSFANIRVADFLTAGFFVTICSYVIIVLTALFWTDVVFQDLASEHIFIVPNKTEIV